MSIEEKFKLALFMVIRNSKVLPKGLELGKTNKEINHMTYNTMQEVLNMVDYKEAKKIYDEGKKEEYHKIEMLFKRGEEKENGYTSRR